MYKTQQMSYNTREKPIYSCTNKYLSKKKEYRRRVSLQWTRSSDKYAAN